MDYYAVAFNKIPVPGDGRSDDSSSEGTQVVVRVDADDGHFLEASWVKEPEEYLPLSSEDAVVLVFEEIMDLGFNVDEIDTRDIDAYLVYTGSSPFYPDWCVSVLDLVFFVSQDGIINT